jgi:hypothetical protein
MAFDNIKLEKGLYTVGKSFSDALEELDPSENYRGTELEGLDAYERQLKRFDIRVSGPNSDSISKFFSTSSAAVLFPEYISRAVRYGMDYCNDVSQIIATTTKIDSLDYRSLQSNCPEYDYALEPVSEGETMDELDISVRSDLTTLTKFGKIITASYEAIKYQKLDLFSLTLKHIGESISKSLFFYAYDKLAETASTPEISNDEPSFESLLTLWSALQPFNMTTLIMPVTYYSGLLGIDEFKDAAAGLNFHGTGNTITPFGANVLFAGDEKVIALDKNYALEMVETSDGVVTEFDKLIDRQLERVAISCFAGFNVLQNGAVKSNDINTD